MYEIRKSSDGRWFEIVEDGWTVAGELHASLDAALASRNVGWVYVGSTENLDEADIRPGEVAYHSAVATDDDTHTPIQYTTGYQNARNAAPREEEPR